MPHTPDQDHFKTFAESVRSISKLGKRLAALQADVVAIRGLPVDERGGAEVDVSVGKSVSLHTGLRLRPAVMLGAKRKEILRITESLKSEFSEILDHAMELAARCERAAPTAAGAAPHLAVALKHMQGEINDMIERSDPSRASLSQVADPLAPPLRPRIATPGFSKTS
jgi:hypothetical protein